MHLRPGDALVGVLEYGMAGKILSLRERIFWRSWILVGVGAGLVAVGAAIWYFGDGAGAELIVPVFRIRLDLLLALLGAVTFLNGVVRLAMPGRNRTLRMLRAYGPVDMMLAELDAELPGARKLHDQASITEHWLICDVDNNWLVLRLDCLTMAVRRDPAVGMGALVMGDCYGNLIELTMDGFESAKIVAMLRERAPRARFDGGMPALARWRQDPGADLGQGSPN
jgi:hypothetical protein